MGREQAQVRHLAHLMARIVIASFFIAKSVGFIVDPNSLEAVFARLPLPEYFIWPNLMFQFVAAMFILIGFQTRLAAALLAIHVFWSSFIINYGDDPIGIALFWKDLALMSGLMLVFSHGRGGYALDNYFERRTLRQRRAAQASARQEAAADARDGMPAPLSDLAGHAAATEGEATA